jgi:hypothetical protein
LLRDGLSRPRIPRPAAPTLSTILARRNRDTRIPASAIFRCANSLRTTARVWSLFVSRAVRISRISLFGSAPRASPRLVARFTKSVGRRLEPMSPAGKSCGGCRAINRRCKVASAPLNPAHSVILSAAKDPGIRDFSLRRPGSEATPRVRFDFRCARSRRNRAEHFSRPHT